MAAEVGAAEVVGDTSAPPATIPPRVRFAPVDRLVNGAALRGRYFTSEGGAW